MIKQVLFSLLLSIWLNGWSNDVDKTSSLSLEIVAYDSLNAKHFKGKPVDLYYSDNIKAHLRNIDSLQQSAPIDWMEVMKANYRLSEIYTITGEYTKSIEAALNGVRISEKYNNDKAVYVGYALVGRGLRKQGNYKEAFYYFRKRIERIKEIEVDDPIRDKRLMTFYKSLALVYQEQGIQLDSALYFHELALSLRKKVNKVGNPSNYINIGFVLYKLGKYQRAIDSLRFADSLNKTIKHRQSAINWTRRNIIIQNYLGMVYFKTNNIPLAIKNYKRSAIQSRKTGIRQELMNSYRGLSECYERNREIDSALLFKNKYISLKDSIYTEKSKQHIAELTAVYETEKKNLQIKNQNEEISNNRAKINRFIIALLILILLVVFLIVFYRIRRLKREKELQSKFSQDLINKVEHERERISRDLHDSIGQNLLIIKNQNSLLKLKLKDQELIEKSETINTFAAQTIEELREISNNLTPYQLGRLGLTKAIDDLIDKVAMSSNITCVKEINNIDELVSPNLQINLYRIVQESLNNIIKHSQATEISFIVSTSKIEIFDNGVGFNTNRFSAGMGIGNLYERAKLLNADSKIESGPNLGTKITLQFKQVS